MLRLTVSITSTKASFLRYLTSLRRHEMAPVAWIVILDASSRCGRARLGQGRAHERGDREEGRKGGREGRTTACSDLTPSYVMYILSVSDSEFCGYPKSRISACEEGPGSACGSSEAARESSAKHRRGARRSTCERAPRQCRVSLECRSGGRDAHKVVLDALLVELAEVGPAEVDEPVRELVHERGVGVLREQSSVSARADGAPSARGRQRAQGGNTLRRATNCARADPSRLANAELERRLTCLQTATSQRPPWRTWKKVVLLSVIKGEVGGVDEATTWMRKMSEMERLRVCGSESARRPD